MNYVSSVREELSKLDLEHLKTLQQEFDVLEKTGSISMSAYIREISNRLLYADDVIQMQVIGNEVYRELAVRFVPWEIQ